MKLWLYYWQIGERINGLASHEINSVRSEVVEGKTRCLSNCLMLLFADAAAATTPIDLNTGPDQHYCKVLKKSCEKPLFKFPHFIKTTRGLLPTDKRTMT